MDYEELSHQVIAAGIDSTIAEVHGIACGLLCAKAQDVQKLWLDALFSELEQDSEEVAVCRRSLDAMLQQAADQLTNDRMGLALMLPDEGQPFVVRAAAVRDWCQGFLYGFGLAGKQPDSLFSQDAGEAIRDFGEISRMDLEELGEGAEAEEALVELEEYLWVAALLIHQDVLGSKQVH